MADSDAPEAAAVSIAAAAVHEAAEPMRVTPEQLGVVQLDAPASQLQFDIGNLTAFDPSPLDAERFATDCEAACLEAATSITQALTTQLFSLPSEAAPVGRIVKLPAPTTALPRGKPVPQQKPLTRWQKYAQEKGIKNRKRSKLLWDENTQEWRRRHGYKKANDIADIPIIEAKPTDQPGEDPFTAAIKDRKERVAAHEGRQLRNVKRAVKQHGGAALPSSLKLSANLPKHGRGKPTKRKELHDDIKSASLLAGVSTASVGKHDKRLPGEKDGERERQVTGKRRKFLPVTDRSGAEPKHMTAVIDKIIRQKSDNILDLDRAAGSLEAERRRQRHAEKAAAAGDDDGSARKGKKTPKKGGGGGKRGGKSTGGKGSVGRATPGTSKGGKKRMGSGGGPKGGKGGGKKSPGGTKRGKR